MKRLLLENALFFVLGIVGCALVASYHPTESSFLSLFGGVFFGAGFTPLVLNGWNFIIGPHPKGKRKLDGLRTLISFIWMLFGFILLAAQTPADDVRLQVAQLIGDNAIGFCVLFIITKVRVSAAITS